jgi:hypothetical protein
MQRGILSATYAFALVAAAAYFDRVIVLTDAGDGMRTFATRLAPYASKGYTMAVTEAGQLPLYSDWRVIDALGLNDSWIAHHGGRISAEYLDRSKPEIIMLHDFPTGGTNVQMLAILRGDTDVPQDTPATLGDFVTLSAYARQHNYILAAAFSPGTCNYHLYYVRRDFPDSDAIVSLIRNNPYYFLDDGVLSTDLRNNIMPSAAVCSSQ